MKINDLDDIENSFEDEIQDDEELDVKSSKFHKTKPGEYREKYNDSIREKIDDQKKRDKFKERQFGDKKTIKDPYSGNTIHKDSNKAGNKYGKDNKTKHTADVDHTKTLKNIYNENKDNPFLTMEDLKRIANNEKNYKVTNSKMNRSKGGKSQKDYIKKNKNNYTKEQIRNMMKEDLKAGVALKTDIAVTTVKNAGIMGAKAGVKGAGIAAVESSIKHTKILINGEGDYDEAIGEVICEAIEGGVTAGKREIENKIVEGCLNKTVTKLGDKELAKKIASFNSAGGAAKIVAVISEAGQAVTKYINGDITEAELVLELGERGTALAASFYMGAVGNTVGGIVGGTIGTIIAGPAGGTVGAAVGVWIGDLIGSMVGYFMGSAIYRKVKDLVSSDYIEHLREQQMLFDMLTEQLEQYRVQLEYNVKLANFENEQMLIAAFQTLHDALLNDDLDGSTKSINAICEQFGMTVRFETMDEFESFMLDNNKKTLLG